MSNHKTIRDSVWTDLCGVMQTLRLKPKHLTSIFTLLSAILLLSNIQFVEADMRGMSASVANVYILEQVAQLLGMLPNDLAQMLMNQTNYIHKETYTVLLNVKQNIMQ